MTFELGPGAVLGRYELLAPVAKGGMAQVWLARLHGSRGFSKLVAVKTILAKTTDELRSEAMLLEEARLAALIQHPNIVTTLDLGEEGGVLYLVMEWVHGETLRDVFHKSLASGGMPLHLAVNIIAQACKGLHAAHEATNASGSPLHLVHRDVSPQNVLLSYSGVVKVADFGVAKATMTTTEVTQPGELKGKVAFMSPEQLNCEPLDRRSDVFAMGTLLYMVTTGHHPFRGPTTVRTFNNIVACNPPRPSAVSRHYPPDLEHVVLKALAPNPAQRWKSAAEMFAALLDTRHGSQGHFESVVAGYMREVMAEKERERIELMRRFENTNSGGSRFASLSFHPERPSSPITTAPSFQRDSQPPPVESISPAVVSLHATRPEDGAFTSGASSFRGWRQRGAWLVVLTMSGALLFGLTARGVGFGSQGNVELETPFEGSDSRRGDVTTPVFPPTSSRVPNETSPTDEGAADTQATHAQATSGQATSAEDVEHPPSSSRRRRDTPPLPSGAPASTTLPSSVRTVDAWDRRHFGGRN